MRASTARRLARRVTLPVGLLAGVLTLVLAFTLLGAAAAESTRLADSTATSPAEPRDRLADAVSGARDALLYSDRGYTDAAERFREAVDYDGAGLERAYAERREAYRRQAAAAEAVRTRVDAVEAAGQAMLAEWEGELALYADSTLRDESRVRLEQSRQRVTRLVGTMRRAERAQQPALAALRDRTLALRHALNARAVGALDAASATVGTDAEAVRRETQAAVAEADRFLSEADSAAAR